MRAAGLDGTAQIVATRYSVDYLTGLQHRLEAQFAAVNHRARSPVEVSTDLADGTVTVTAPPAHVASDAQERKIASVARVNGPRVRVAHNATTGRLR